MGPRELELFGRFLADYPHQPATAFWRAIEIQALLDVGLPDGLGLDLGCGDGKLTRIILERTGPRALVGLDVDSAEVEIAQQSGVYQRTLLADGASIPEADASFDFVLSNSVLEHIPALPETLAEAARVLRPGGVLRCTVPAPRFRELLRGPLVPSASRERYLRNLDERLRHVHYWSAERWTHELGEFGLVPDEFIGYLDGPQVRRWETLSRFTGGLAYALLRGKSRPIEIQRRLGVRRNGLSLPRPLSSVLARLLCLGVRGERRTSVAEAGCLLISARKK